VVDVRFSALAEAALSTRIDAPYRQPLVSWLRVTLKERPWQFGVAAPEELGGQFRVGIIGPMNGMRIRVWYEIEADESVMVWSLGRV